MHHRHHIALTLVASLMAPLAGCTTGGTSTDRPPADGAGDLPRWEGDGSGDSDDSGEPAEPAERNTDCQPSKLDELDLSVPPDRSVANHSTYWEEWYVSTSTNREAADPLTNVALNLKKFRGSLSSLGIGLYRIAGDDTDPNTCSLCVTVQSRLIEEGAEPDYYMAIAGELSITDYDDADDIFDGALTELQVVPMTFAPGDQACESNNECPGAQRCDIDGTGTCLVATIDTSVCPTTLDIVEL